MFTKKPLADKIRPATLDEVAGQSHLIGLGKPLRKIIESAVIPCMLFYGPSGVGKTTIANIIANKTDMQLHKLNGTSASTADIKAIISQATDLQSSSLMDYGENGNKGVLLYLDEIQYLNKKQQQSLLQYIESGEITLIASTTENPYFYVYGAILSRCTVFEFKNLTPGETAPAIKRGFSAQGTIVSDEVVQIIAQGCGGDVRKALNAVELCVLVADGKEVTSEVAHELVQKSAMRYDRDGDAHYDALSAFQKSIRGSDENAALHYLARLILADDLPSVCRRLLVTAAEDIGLAYPNAISIVKSCVDSALQVGLPEARIPLAQAVILLCTAPKSNSAYLAIDAAIADIRSGNLGDVPRQLQNKHCDGIGGASGQGYLYPHDYPGRYVKQQYLPDSLKDRVYYKFADNKNEQAALAYRQSRNGV
ncbi:MAG: replication-associated recombination protein A [Oscillospiraceae bacterium]|nr:replication-associated recombination protein A [Oscillospiraceae bacterium]